jgi:hypothetical protein
MTFSDRYQQLKMLFIVIAGAIVLSSLYFSHRIIFQLAAEETHSMEIWAEANRQLALDDGKGDVTLILKILSENKSIPAILIDSNDQPVNLEYGICNIQLPKENQEEFIAKKIRKLKAANPPIKISIDRSTTYFVCYDESFLIKSLRWFTYILFAVVVVFLVIAFWIFSTTKKAEQNQVWIGLSRETAHQLGTPISSLWAWVEILKEKKIEHKLITEISKDVNRLRIIAERFSKIGSKPDLEPVVFSEVLENAIAYLRNRTSQKVNIITHYPDGNTTEVILNVPLFEWVIENLTKNAIDAMDGEGQIDITLYNNQDSYIIDFQDTGKGIPKSKFRTVFNPGFTTKSRGWGLGLSLVKRIIEEYHSGKIFVKQSELGKGTTFRILLKKDKKAKTASLKE